MGLWFTAARPAWWGGGGLSPAPLAAVVEASLAAHPALGTPLCSALGWVFRSADRTNAPPPCGLPYGGCPLLLPAGGCGSQQRDSSPGGGLGPAPLAAVALDPPAAHPASGTPLCSALGWVFRSADRTNAPPPYGLTYRRCPLLPPAPEQQQAW